MARSSIKSRKSRSSRGRKARNSEGAKWFGVDRRIIIVSGAILLILIFLFVPMWSAVKVIEVTDTVMVTVQKQVPETVTEDVPTKVYIGYLQEVMRYVPYAQSVYVVGGWGYGVAPGNAGAEADTGSAGSSGGYGPVYGPSYNDYGNGPSGRRYQVDVSDEIVELQQANGPDGSLTMTLTNADGKQTVYRYIDQFDLTKTGEIKIPTKITKMNTVSEEQPQQITKEQVITIKVPLLQLLRANLTEQ